MLRNPKLTGEPLKVQKLLNLGTFQTQSEEARVNTAHVNSISTACSVIFVIALGFNNSQYGRSTALII